MLGTKKTPSECPPGTKRTSKGNCKKVKAITLPSGDMVGVLEGQRKQYVTIPSDMPGIPSDGSDDSGLETSLVSAIQASLKKISDQLNKVNTIDEKLDKLIEEVESDSNNDNSEVIIPKRRGGGRSRKRKSRMKKSKKTLRHHRS